jgi:hypothetical protein
LISIGDQLQKLPRYEIIISDFLLLLVHGQFSIGVHLADASVFISCVTTLAVFDISKCVENGAVIEPVHENTTGTIR